MNFDYTQVNLFDGLPDHVLLLVFNKVEDAKALSFAMCVSKRFRSIIPEVNSVLLSIPTQSVLGKRPPREDKSLFKNLLSKVIVKPLNFLLGFLKSQKGSSYSSSSSSRDVDIESCFLPHEVLKPFKSLRKLEIKLPKSDFEMKGSNLLKWKAEFGSQIKSCVLVGATSISSNTNCEEEEEHVQEIEQVNMRDVSEDGFKLRIIWSLSCLIAASARHVFVKKTLKQHEMAEHLVIRDESNQGLVTMNKEQIQEFKKSMISGGKGENEEGLLSEKTKVPGLRMKMWYVPVLKLPGSGKVMKGATLVVINPVVGGKKAEEGDGSWVAEAFHDGQGEEGKVFEEAVKELMKKEKSCILEMNSF